MLNVEILQNIFVDQNLCLQKRFSTLKLLFKQISQITVF